MDEEQKERYTATLSLKGNKPYLFGSDIYANESAGEDYDIPGEALADPDFAALIAEAEKYLGFPYVWCLEKNRPRRKICFTPMNSAFLSVKRILL